MRPFRLLAALVLLIAVSPSAEAFQKFEEYRIRGDELIDVRVLPQEPEDPASMVLSVGTDGNPEQTIEIESDMGLDDCFAELQNLIGNPQAYAQIRVHVNAYSMNGVVVTECAVLNGLH